MQLLRYYSIYCSVFGVKSVLLRYRLGLCLCVKEGCCLFYFCVSVYVLPHTYKRKGSFVFQTTTRVQTQRGPHITTISTFRGYPNPVVRRGTPYNSYLTTQNTLDEEWYTARYLVAYNHTYGYRYTPQVLTPLRVRAILLTHFTM